jgi:hypothetical protein
MVSLLGSVRGTVHGVLGASRHLAWYVTWHTGAPGGVRECRASPPAGAAAQAREAA